MNTKSKLAIVSFILGIFSFIQILGLEKAILSIVFGAVALKEILSDPELKGKNYAYLGIILGSLYILVLIGIMVVKGPEILKSLGRLI